MKNLFSKIAKVTAEMRQANQSGSHSYPSFDYSTRDDVVEVMKEQFTKHGVVFLPSCKVQRIDAHGTHENLDKQEYHALVEVSIVLGDADSGESVEMNWSGEAIMKQGKAVPAASTQAIRYWALNAFLQKTDEIEQVYQGNQPAEYQNVQRQPASNTAQQDADKLISHVRGLDFNDQQVSEFKRHLARTYNVTSFDQVPPGRIKRWYELMSEKSDAEASQTIMNLIGAQAA
jgi:hypothetical protein